MPFAYYGAKHKLARYYPPPTRTTIIEPFAGSAAYSCYWVQRRQIERVLLFDVNEYIVNLWHRLQRMTADEVDRAVADGLANERTREPLVAFCGGSANILGLQKGKDQKVTPLMKKGAPPVARRIKRTLLFMRNWTITNDIYENAPDIDATWFVDPPYAPLLGETSMTAGNAYQNGASGIDYEQLGLWCQSRQGQVLVCEQQPASWLPFATFKTQVNYATHNVSMRTEVLWHRCDTTPEQITLNLEMS